MSLRDYCFFVSDYKKLCSFTLCCRSFQSLVTMILLQVNLNIPFNFPFWRSIRYFHNLWPPSYFIFQWWNLSSQFISTLDSPFHNSMETLLLWSQIRAISFSRRFESSPSKRIISLFLLVLNNNCSILKTIIYVERLPWAETIIKHL